MAERRDGESDYRTAIATAISRELSGRSDIGPNYVLADAVLSVPHPDTAEVARLRAELAEAQHANDPAFRALHTIALMLDIPADADLSLDELIEAVRAREAKVESRLARAVVLPFEWRGQVTDALVAWGPAAAAKAKSLIESWRVDAQPAEPPRPTPNDLQTAPNLGANREQAQPTQGETTGGYRAGRKTAREVKPPPSSITKPARRVSDGKEDTTDA